MRNGNIYIYIYKEGREKGAGSLRGPFCSLRERQLDKWSRRDKKRNDQMKPKHDYELEQGQSLSSNTRLRKAKAGAVLH